MKEIIFVSNNQHKVKEVQQAIGDSFIIKSLSEIGFYEEIPETQDNLKGNALQKAETIYSKYRVDCFADDTGLEIDALGGKPGVFSARYAGEECNSEDNIRKVLKELRGITNRNARFRTIICLILDGKKHFFEGVAEGKIIDELKGKEGFGYDPIFVPTGYDKSFAEIDLALKNKISHRGKAVSKLSGFLKEV
jgi:XTP/dITP diphosphohydrolase